MLSRSVVSTLCNPLEPARLLCSWDFPGKNTEVGCHFLLCTEIQFLLMSRAATGHWSHFLKNCLFSNVRILKDKWCHFYHPRALWHIKLQSFRRPSPFSHFKTLQERLHRRKIRPTHHPTCPQDPGWGMIFLILVSENEDLYSGSMSRWLLRDCY